MTFKYTKTLALLLGLICLGVSGFGYAGVDCDTLKNEISEKIQSHGVKATDFELKVVDINEESTGKQVGTCQGNTRKIMYSKFASTSKPSDTEDSSKQ